jgi:ribonuclease P protein component
MGLPAMPSGPSARLGLPRSRRIKHGRDFDRARTQGKRTVEGCLILNWLPLPAGAASRLGVITSRKLGEAVVRSRARRLLRECFRLHQRELVQPADVVLVARQGILGRKLRDVESDYLRALRRARLLKPGDEAKAPSVR